jgi:hypothetical protein
MRTPGAGAPDGYRTVPAQYRTCSAKAQFATAIARAKMMRVFINLFFDEL